MSSRTVRKLTVEKRTHDWIAYFDDSPKTWECGATHTEAIGKLFVTCIEDFHCELRQVSRLKQLESEDFHC